ncbi:MAG: aminopeptidase N [Oligoflexia bacterium]|nr:aminopeptidase N [Oligoflexia bacterium]
MNSNSKSKSKSNPNPEPIYLKNYSAPDYLIPRVDLCFELDDNKTLVHARLKIIKNPKKKNQKINPPLILNGQNLKLQKISLNGKKLSKGKDGSAYQISDDKLIIELKESKKSKDFFIVETLVEIDPPSNKTLEGLYKSGTIFCTQNEPEGMRKITYFIDRPDIMSRFTTMIIADKDKYPLLLSNGNEVAKGDLEGGRHYVTWKDPFPKPCYLFALVAGDLGVIKDRYITRSNKNIDLRIYCDKGNESRCHSAMIALKHAMEWDENVFGLEYDLDIYMIVAVDSFNMGAMENKGLNIFNSKYVLANQETATDNEFKAIEAVIGHEYFHNWTGNRVTCRDWFQLTLKEGLTVFRDQEFSSTLNSRSVERIGNVTRLRLSQFPEDAGPMSHPIRPSSYIEINNFYTSTVYNKGSEVIRMIATLIGMDNFRKGITKYFETFDGQAVTTEDFIFAMEKASNFDLSQFKRWYSRAGTPHVTVNYQYDPKKQTFTLKTKQQTNGDDIKEPLLIPLSFALIASDGKELSAHSKVLHLNSAENTFTFKNIKSKPIPSINRNFSAPIKLTVPYSTEDLIFIMANDSDDFNRFEAMQSLTIKIIKDLMEEKKANTSPKLHQGYVDAFGKLLDDDHLDNTFKAMILTLPNISIIANDFNIIDYHAIHETREFIKRELSKKYYQKFYKLYHHLNDELANKKDIEILDQHSASLRALKNVSLNYLMVNALHNSQPNSQDNTQENTHESSQEIIDLCSKQFFHANNMTDRLYAMMELADVDREIRFSSFSFFYDRFKDDQLTLLKWFMVQANSKLPDTTERIKLLMKNPKFDILVPNIVRSLILVWANNHIIFHNKDHSLAEENYKFLTDLVLKIDKDNPSMAAALVSIFNNYKRLDQNRQELIAGQLKRLIGSNLSKNTYEIVYKNLNN